MDRTAYETIKKSGRTCSVPCGEEEGGAAIIRYQFAEFIKGEHT
jgi:hypothetical protein